MLTRRNVRLLKYCARQWPRLLAVLLLTFASASVAALQPWPLKLLVDHGIGRAAPPALFRAALGWLGLAPTPTVLVVAAAVASLAVFALGGLLEMALGWAWTSAGQRMVHDLSSDLFHRLQRLSLLFHSRRSVGDLLSRLNDTWAVYTVADNLLIGPWQQAFKIVTVAAVAWSLDRQLAAVILATAPVLAAATFYFGRRYKERTRLTREAQSRLASCVHQVLTSVPLIQAFTAEGRSRTRYEQLAENGVALAQRGNLMTTLHGLTSGLISTAGIGVVIYLGGLRVLDGGLELGSLLVFLSYVQSLQGASLALLQTYASLKGVEASIDRVLEVLDEESEVRESPTAVAPRMPCSGHLVLEGVTAGYSAGQPVLRGLSLELRPGEVVALVGATGAGKSTLAALIPRFLDPWEGRVLLDGVDLRELTLSGLRSQVSLVLQEPFLLPLSVAENIAYGRPGASRAEVEAAAALANADEFIRRLPEGYETLVGERGSRLSGGQRQRLSIARALLKDAPVLVLDEPTSALDGRTEGAILEGLGRLMSGRTTLIIAHRLATVERSDRVVVLDGGRLVEEGTPVELLARGGVYHSLNAAQRVLPAERGVARERVR